MHDLGMQYSAPAEYVLSRPASGISVSDRRNSALDEIVAGSAVAGLSLTKALEIPSQPGWQLTRHVPQATFEQITRPRTTRSFPRLSR
jgi:hypothetical protein